MPRVTLMCLTVLFFTAAARADDWPQWLGPKRDGVWREKGLLDKFDAKGPREVWRTPIAEGYSGPAVAGGKVYITDRVVDKDAKKPKDGFARSKAEGVERVLCLDQESGKILWTREYRVKYDIAYASGPRTTPVVEGDFVWTLGAMGDLLCLNTAKGDVVWHRKLLEDFGFNAPVWGFSGHPLLDGDRLLCLVGGKGSLVVAFDKKTGKEVWKNLSDVEPGYCPPMIYDIDGIRQLIMWHPSAVTSLNPETGEVYWRHAYYSKGAKGVKVGLTIPTPRLSGDMLFFTAFYDGPLMLKVKGKAPPEMAWKGKRFGETPEKTDGLHSIMSTPFFEGDYIYGVDSYGELRCLDARTGERLWSTFEATTGKELRWGNAFLVKHEDRFVLFNERGDLILARLTPEGYKEICRANILVPTNALAPPAGRRVIWSHPAFANRCVFARNDREMVCVSLAEQK